MRARTANMNNTGHESPIMPWSPDQIALTISTIRRPENYLSGTLESLFSADLQWNFLKQIAIAVDDMDASWMSDLRLPEAIVVKPMTEMEFEKAKSYILCRKACNNYHRALGLADNYRGLIVCEDDIVYRQGWIEKLCQTLNEMQVDGLTEFVLSLYSFQTHESPELRRGDYYSSYTASTFIGTQCMFYTTKELAQISRLLWESGVANYEEPYDNLVRRHCVAKQNLYTPESRWCSMSAREAPGWDGGIFRQRSNCLGRHTFDTVFSGIC